MLKLKGLHDKNIFSLYAKEKSEAFIPYLRRFVRLLALPYCYFFIVNWKACPRSRFQVMSDLLYIFFKLKYYPDNYSSCRFWEKDRNEWVYYYGSSYDPYQKRQLSKAVQRLEYQVLFEDKEVCQQLCEAAGLDIPVCYCILDPNDDYKAKIREIFKENTARRIIIKPVRGSAGRGIVIAYVTGDRIMVRSGNEERALENFTLESRAIVQEIIIQQAQIAKISSSSLNTVRVLTLLTRQQDVIILGTSMRFGVAGSYVDNWSAGGVALGVDKETGRLLKFAFDKKGNSHTHHPSSGIKFDGFQVPRWNEIINLAIKTQRLFPYYMLLGMDIAVSDKGPVLIEINAFPDLVFQEQTSGPLLKDNRILEEFARYDLLVNDHQKKLLNKP
jgi:hypothetical protein